MAKVVLSKRLTVTEDNRHRLRVWVSETSHNIPSTLFVYQQIPVVPLDSGLNQLFVHVASYADLGDYPENASGDDSPFFRLHHFDLVFDSLAYLEQTWQRVHRMVQHTAEDIAKLNGLEPAVVEELILR